MMFPTRPDRLVPRPPRRSRAATAIAALSVATAVAGCASVKPTTSGYLASYPRGDELAETDGLLRRAAPPRALDGIDAFYIEDVAWRSERPPGVRDDAARAAPLLASLRESLAAELSKARPVVSGPGPRTAAVRAAVTDVVEAQPVLNVLTTLLFAPVTNGGAAVEAEVRGPDGAVLAQVSSADTGGLFDFFGFYTAQGHARKACRVAAERLGKALTGRPKEAAR